MKARSGTTCELFIRSILDYRWAPELDELLQRARGHGVGSTACGYHVALRGIVTLKPGGGTGRPWVTTCRQNPAELRKRPHRGVRALVEPPIGIEPMTYSLREGDLVGLHERTTWRVEACHAAQRGATRTTRAASGAAKRVTNASVRCLGVTPVGPRCREPAQLGPESERQPEPTSRAI